MLVLTTIVTCLCLSSLVAYATGKKPVYITGITPVPDVTLPDWLMPLEDVIALLPATTTITVSKGDPIPVTLDWIYIGDPGYPEYLYDPLSSGTYLAIATFELPEGVCQPEPPIPLQVTTTVLQPTSLLPGLYPWATPLTLDFPGFNQPGTYVTATMMLDGVERTYHYYVPTSYDVTEPAPLMISLHGGGSRGLAQLLAVDDYSEIEGFILVCPDYSYAFLIDFVSAIIDKMAEDYNIDTRRVYACGISMGGGASAYLALGLSDKIAAVGLVSGGYTALLGQILPRPMTVIMTGGSKEFNQYNFIPGMLATANWLVQQYHCDPEPEITYWPATPDDRTSVTRWAWSGGIYGTEVIVYGVHEGGHCWLGGLQYAIPGQLGWVTYHVEAWEDCLWPTLKNHAIPEPVDIDIKPSTFPNDINPASQGVIPVAILTTDEFDASTVDAQTVSFGPGGWEAKPVHYALEDVDEDGDIDMILHFRTQETGIQAGDTSATLTGRSFFGTDYIVTV